VILWITALVFISVHGPTGQEIELNIEGIASLRMPDDRIEGHVAPGTNCVVFMTDGKFVPTQETCAEILKLVAAPK
jgi:hypothetical protein